MVLIGAQLINLLGHRWSHLLDEKQLKESTKLSGAMGLDTLLSEYMKNYISHKRKNYVWDMEINMWQEECGENTASWGISVATSFEVF